MSCSYLVLQASRVWVQNKVDESKHEIHSQVDAIAAGTASVVNLTAGESLSDLWCIVVLLKKKKRSSYSLIEATDFSYSERRAYFLALTMLQAFSPPDPGEMRGTSLAFVTISCNLSEKHLLSSLSIKLLDILQSLLRPVPAF